MWSRVLFGVVSTLLCGLSLNAHAKRKGGDAQVMDFTSDSESTATSTGLPETIRSIAPRKKTITVFVPPPKARHSKDQTQPSKDSATRGLANVSAQKTNAKTAAPKAAAAPQKTTAPAAKPDNAAVAASTSAKETPKSTPAQAFPTGRRQLGSIELRELAIGSVFAVETRLDQGAAKSSYGTAFVVKNDGHLLTNYHVVSQAILSPERYQLFLKVNNTELPARVVNFDILSDLALIKVDHNFKRSLTMETRVPTRGERIFSVGLPQDTSMTLVEGIFSDEQAAGFTQFLVLSSPLNAGMSGGPTLDARGSVVGVNKGILATAQNISFLVPATQASSFFAASRKYMGGNKIPYVSEDDGRREIQRQIASFGDGWKQSWQQGRPLELRDWKVHNVPSYLRCWQDQRDEERKHLAVESVRCRSVVGVPMGETSQAGFVDIEFASLQEKSYRQVFDNINNLREKSFARALDSFEKGADSDDHLGKYICHHENINVGQLPFMAEVCLTRLNNDSPLFDTLVMLTWLDERPKKFMASMQLSGFTREQSLFAVKQFVDSIERKAP